jgi:hypothetical protein
MQTIGEVSRLAIYRNDQDKALYPELGPLTTIGTRVTSLYLQSPSRKRNLAKSVGSIVWAKKGPRYFQWTKKGPEVNFQKRRFGLLLSRAYLRAQRVFVSEYKVFRQPFALLIKPWLTPLNISFGLFHRLSLTGGS